MMLSGVLRVLVVRESAETTAFYLLLAGRGDTLFKRLQLVIDGLIARNQD